MTVQERKLQDNLTHEYRYRILNYLLNESRVYEKDNVSCLIWIVQGKHWWPNIRSLLL